MAEGEKEGVEPSGLVGGVFGERGGGEGDDGGVVGAEEEGLEPGGGGGGALDGVLVEEAGVELIGEGGLGVLVEEGEFEGGRVVGGIEGVGEGEGFFGVADLAGGEGAVGALREVLAACEVDAGPVGRVGDGDVADRDADGSLEGEVAEGGGEVERGEGAAVEEEGAGPERADVGGIDGAAELAGGVALEEGTEALEAFLTVPGERRLAGRFHGAAGVARALAGAAAATCAQAEAGFGGVPVEEAPGEAEEVSEPADHGEELGGGVGAQQWDF